MFSISKLIFLFLFLNLRSYAGGFRVSKSKAGLPWSGKDWALLNKKRISHKLSHVSNTKVAKNTILFLGDGMGFSTIAATRVYKAQKEGVKAEDSYLSFEKLPHSGISRTYSVDRITADSASTGTAYLCGVKTNLKTIGVTDDVEFSKCENFNSDTIAPSAAKLALQKGKWVGIVTTAKVTDASPAASYAHTPSREWEAHVPEICKEKVTDIADQLISKEHQNIRVILGGGKDKLVKDRKDKRNLIQEWKEMNKDKNEAYVETAEELGKVDVSKTDYLLGLFADDSMSYMPGEEDKKQPSLLQMTTTALQILSKAPEGFFLFVEGARIDHAHHENMAHRAIQETVAFEEAVKEAMGLTNSQETLVVVTADHSHVMTLGGYGSWNENVLGFAAKEAKDKKDYLQIHYANGPSFPKHRMKDGEVVPRIEINKDDIQKVDYQQDSAIWLDSETHGGEDVPVYSSGPWSHLFQATEEETYIAHVMMHASCLGAYADEEHCVPSSAPKFFPSFLSSFAFLIVVSFTMVL